MRKKIIITGGTGRFGQLLRKIKTKYIVYFPSKKELDILNLNKIEKYFSKKKPNFVIHLAGLSRPMNIHNSNINKSIDLNIIGTANVTKACSRKKIKLIYLSTNYVYQGTKGFYKETDPVLPFNNYAWSKLGGECAVQMYRNSLILRVIMSEKPFAHDHAFSDIKTNFLYHYEVANLIPKILDEFGVLNVGGKLQSIYKFAKKFNKNVKKSLGKKIYPPRISINTDRLNKILKKKK